MVEWVKPSLNFYSNEQVRIPVKSKNILECRGTTSYVTSLKKRTFSNAAEPPVPRNYVTQEKNILECAEPPVPRNYVTQETEDQVRIPVKSEKIQNSRFDSQ